MDSEKLKKEQPVREAVALSYNPDDGAPTVVAAGKGIVADNILKAAEAAGIPLHEDASLAHSLNALRVGEEIPPELYAVVARILLYVADMDKKMEESLGKSPSED